MAKYDNEKKILDTVFVKGKMLSDDLVKALQNSQGWDFETAEKFRKSCLMKKLIKVKHYFSYRFWNIKNY